MEVKEWSEDKWWKRTKEGEKGSEEGERGSRERSLWVGVNGNRDDGGREEGGEKDGEEETKICVTLCGLWYLGRTSETPDFSFLFLFLFMDFLDFFFFLCGFFRLAPSSSIFYSLLFPTQNGNEKLEMILTLQFLVWDLKLFTDLIRRVWEKAWILTSCLGQRKVRKLLQ